MRTLRAPHHGEPEPAARRQPSLLFRSSAEAFSACANLLRKVGVGETRIPPEGLGYPLTMAVQTGHLMAHGCGLAHW